jgi:hypothetical protein
MDNENFNDDGFGRFGTSGYGGGDRLNLALLEDLAALLRRHGYPPRRGYALAEVTARPYRLTYPRG